MLITKRSSRRSGPFRSRFADGMPDFPIRQYQRCREDFFSGILQAVILGALTVSVGVFGLTVWRVLQKHAPGLHPWLLRGVGSALILLVLVTIWRLGRRIGDLREIRREMLDLRRQIAAKDDAKM
jgi:hypothetical protein